MSEYVQAEEARPAGSLIDISLNAQEELIQHSHGLLDALEGRLERILDHPLQEAKAMADLPPKAPIASINLNHALQESNREIDKLNNRIRSVLDRLEL